jgi:hypothetical protein
MKGNLLINERHVLDVGTIVEIVVWRLPKSVRGSEHRFKYRLALVVGGVCVLRFDNETGKGDHKHVANTEEPYKFNGPEALLEDFWNEVDKWRR